jgi:hypothetical protein
MLGGQRTAAPRWQQQRQQEVAGQARRRPCAARRARAPAPRAGAGAGADSGSSGSGDDASPPDVIGDWRAFRAKLMAQSGAAARGWEGPAGTRAGGGRGNSARRCGRCSRPPPAADAGACPRRVAGEAEWAVRQSEDNMRLLEIQNPALAAGNARRGRSGSGRGGRRRGVPRKLPGNTLQG